MSTQQMATMEEQVKDFTMTIRELLMSYYKGDCDQTFHSVYNHNLTFQYVPLEVESGRRPYRYEQREHAIAQPAKLYYLNSPLMKLTKQPEQVIFYLQVMQRSPQLQEVNKQLKSFFGRYLSGVTMKENNTLYSSHKAKSERDPEIGPSPRELYLGEPAEYETDTGATIRPGLGGYVFSGRRHQQEEPAVTRLQTTEENGNIHVTSEMLMEWNRLHSQASAPPQIRYYYSEYDDLLGPVPEIET